MGKLAVSREPVLTILDSPNVGDLLGGYAAESANSSLGAYNPNRHAYLAMEQAGILYALCAWEDGKLIGFLVMLATVVPHYSRLAATSESFYVLPEKRSTGAGRELMKEAEKLAGELGCVGLFISAPVDSRLDLVLPRAGYKPTNNVYFKCLA